MGVSYELKFFSPVYLNRLLRARNCCLDTIIRVVRFAVIKDCRGYFFFELPSELLGIRFTKSMSKRGMS